MNTNNAKLNLLGRSMEAGITACRLEKRVEGDLLHFTVLVDVVFPEPGVMYQIIAVPVDIMDTKLKTMGDIEYPAIGAPKTEIVLDCDLLLDDTAWSSKSSHFAKAGDTVTIWTTSNYGVVYHPQFGIFRY